PAALGAGRPPPEAAGPGARGPGGPLPFAAVQTPQRLIHHSRSTRTITSPTSTATSIIRGPAATDRRRGQPGSCGRPWVGFAGGGDGVLSPHPPVSAAARGRLRRAPNPPRPPLCVP